MAAAAMQRLRASIDPAYAATLHMAQAQDIATAAMKAGVTTEEEAIRTIDLLAARLTGVDAAGDMARATAGLQALRASIDPAYAASLQLAQAQDVVRAAVAAGIATEAQAAAVLDQFAAKQRDLADTSGPDAAAAAMDRLRASVDPAHAASLQLAQGQEVARAAIAAGVVTEEEAIRTLTRLTDRLNGVDAAGDMARATAGLQALRASIDPAYAAGLRLAQAQDVVANAVRMGAASEADGAQVLQKFKTSLDAAEGASQRFAGAQGQMMRGASANAALTGNVAAQFNDIGVMLAAGQNPLQLALQQGTQLSQVLNQVGGGARGALGALRAGFVGMLNPVSLLTIGIIAGGAALIQWGMQAFGAGEKAKSLEDAVKDLDTAMADFKTRSSASLEDLKAKYGEVTPEVIRLNDEMSKLAGVQAIIAATEAMRSLKAETEGSWFAAFNDKAFTDQFQVGEWLKPEIFGEQADGQFGNVDPIIDKYIAAVDKASSAVGWDAQIASVQEIERIIIEAAGGIDNMSLKQAEMLVKVQGTETALRQMKAAQEGSTDATTKSNAAMQALLDKALAEVALRRAIAKYGQDSIQVASMRVDAERQAMLATVAASEAAQSLKDQFIAAWEAAHKIEAVTLADGIRPVVRVAGALKDELKDAWDAARGISGADMAGNISAALGPAAALAAKLWEAATAAARAANQTAANEQVKRIPGGVDALANGDLNWSGGNWTRPVPIKPEKGGGGGGGRTAPKTIADFAGEAKKAMAELDLAIATIAEKVKAGLMSTAEAEDAVASAKGRAANELAGLVAQIDRLAPAGSTAANDIRTHMKGLAADLKSTGADLAATLSEGFKSPFKDFLTGAKTAHEAMDALGDFVIDKFAEMAAQKAVTGFIEPLFNSIFAGAGNWFGGGATVAAHAKGGVPDAAPGATTTAAPLAAWRDRVVERPTLFPMRAGVGLMGEAGAEAILPLGGGGVLAMMAGRETRLPLARGPDGRLGVQVPDWDGGASARPPVAFAKGGILSGGGGVVGAADGWTSGNGFSADPRRGADTNPSPAPAPVVNVNVTTPEGQTARVNQRMQGGELNIEIMIEQVEGRMAGNMRAGRGPLTGAIADAFGLPRATR
jgi:hypothetical protein